MNKAMNKVEMDINEMTQVNGGAGARMDSVMSMDTMGFVDSQLSMSSMGSMERMSSMDSSFATAGRIVDSAVI